MWLQCLGSWKVYLFHAPENCTEHNQALSSWETPCTQLGGHFGGILSSSEETDVNFLHDCAEVRGSVPGPGNPHGRVTVLLFRGLLHGSKNIVIQKH